MDTGGPAVHDSSLLRKTIEESGITMIHIANNLGIQSRTLLCKIDGKQDFWWHEVVLLRKILRLTDEEFKKIFG